jgi:hypothetical protein
VAAEAQRLLDGHHDHASIATLLNQAGMTTARGKSFNAKNVRHILHGRTAPPMGDLRATGGAV